MMLAAGRDPTDEVRGGPGPGHPLYEKTLADSARVLGEDHPQTKVVRDNLAAACQ
jgi:hypothetical protein